MIKGKDHWNSKLLANRARAPIRARTGRNYNFRKGWVRNEQKGWIPWLQILPTMLYIFIYHLLGFFFTALDWWPADFCWKCTWGGKSWVCSVHLKPDSSFRSALLLWSVRSRIKIIKWYFWSLDSVKLLFDILLFNNCRQKKVRRDEGKHVRKWKRRLICPV